MILKPINQGEEIIWKREIIWERVQENQTVYRMKLKKDVVIMWIKMSENR